MSDLRPTLFLAQLSNLLAGNISIVHGVTGSSRTFMGEESAGVDAVRIALSRIAGRAERHRPGRRFATMPSARTCCCSYEIGGYAMKEPYRSRCGSAKAVAGLWRSARSARFLVLEIARHARRRATPSRWRALTESSIRPVRRQPGAVTAALARMWDGKIAPQARVRPRRRRSPGAGGAEPRHRGRARVALDLIPDPAGPRHRHLSRPCGGAAIPHERRACRGRARTRGSLFPPATSAVEAADGRAAHPGGGDRGRSLARRRSGAGRSGRLKDQAKEQGTCAPDSARSDRRRHRHGRGHLARRAARPTTGAS